MRLASDGEGELCPGYCAVYIASSSQTPSPRVQLDPQDGASLPDDPADLAGICFP